MATEEEFAELVTLAKNGIEGLHELIDLLKRRLDIHQERFLMMENQINILKAKVDRLELRLDLTLDIPKDTFDE